MLTVIQRVTHANVIVKQQQIGAIERGIVALIAIEKNDTKKEAKQLIDRIINYRIFADMDDKMNLSLKSIDGGLLLIPQFTLAADTRKSNRPSFTPAAPPVIAHALFDDLLDYAKQQHPHVASGLFGADMQLTLCNDGPVTFTLKTNNSKA